MLLLLLLFLLLLLAFIFVTVISGDSALIGCDDFIGTLNTTFLTPATDSSYFLGEYSGHVPKIAPDVLRQMAITFSDEVHPLTFLNCVACWL
jgi:hypothetical protein